ncbi:MAG TPA: alternative ribosome rescue aminoacyl-tRNA hydrolase ArfB [Novosphingobium sp.]|nr:alternative ribosome rescue aminoacyl-tRNA hydrolase ArfB [Novosphingobium sp.]
MDEALAERALALVSESFIAAAGPGGQNVNKVATAVQLRLDVFALGLDPQVFARLKTLAGSRMTGGGEIVLTARRFRTQDVNRADARARLLALLEGAHKLPAKRARTRLNRINKGERLESKKKRGAVKAGRGRVSFD